MLAKKMLVPMAAVAVIGAGLYGVTQASAASTAANPQSSLVQKLSETFHIDKAKVQAVFDEEMAGRQQEHESQYEAKLDKAVKDGQLTAAQKTAILAKHKELKAKMMAGKDQTDDTARRTAMKEMREEVETWATQNNIDAKWLMGFGMPRDGGSHMKGDHPRGHAPGEMSGSQHN